jgi:2'-5' RNA ligase
VPAANLHLTLRFLGNVDQGRLERLEGLMEEVRSPPFELAVGGVGAFGSGRHKRVLWLGIASGGEAAGALAAQIELACVEAGLIQDERPFRAHVTLARARDRRGAAAPELSTLPGLEPWTANEFVLFRSKTGPGGAEYIPLRTFGLFTL